MTKDDVAQPTGSWHAVASLEQLRRNGRMVVKLPGKQLALFSHGDAVHACNNRCPHEGYPLAEGALGPDCVLTCHWHNWQFDLRDGSNLHGGDGLTIYPVAQRDGQVWVDLSEPAPALRQQQHLAALEQAMADDDLPRIAREAARLQAAGGTADDALRQAILQSHERLRYGMTHAWAAADGWLRLRDELEPPAQQLACLAEALSYIARDTLREPPWPLPAPQSVVWNAQLFLNRVEAQDEAGAGAQLLAGLEEAPPQQFDACLTEAALAHYNDFGHSLIYLVHVRSLVQRVGPSVAPALWQGWLRALRFATREDLLPDFRAYAPALAQWPAAFGRSTAVPDPQAWFGLAPRAALALSAQHAAQCVPLALHQALMCVGAMHLMHFDAAWQDRSDGPVRDNIGWLDFSHALTFAHAARVQCVKHPQLWPAALAQMTLFAARNAKYLRAQDQAGPTGMHDAATFDAQCIVRLLDHGTAPHIYPAHLLKTWLAVRDEIRLGVAPATTSWLRAAVVQLFAACLKQRHILRNAQQALDIVQRGG